MVQWLPDRRVYWTTAPAVACRFFGNNCPRKILSIFCSSHTADGTCRFGGEHQITIEAEMEMRLRSCLGAIGLDSPDLCLRARMLGSCSYARDNIRFVISELLLAALPFPYGGAHFAAWNSHFPAKIERDLWRVFAIIATCYVPIVLLLCILYDRACRASVVKGLLTAIIFMVVVGMPLFFCARAFLTVGSFLSLRSLPRGSFQTVFWSNYWPPFLARFLEAI